MYRPSDHLALRCITPSLTLSFMLVHRTTASVFHLHTTASLSIPALLYRLVIGAPCAVDGCTRSLPRFRAVIFWHPGPLHVQHLSTINPSYDPADYSSSRATSPAAGFGRLLGRGLLPQRATLILLPVALLFDHTHPSRPNPATSSRQAISRGRFVLWVSERETSLRLLVPFSFFFAFSSLVIVFFSHCCHLWFCRSVGASFFFLPVVLYGSEERENYCQMPPKKKEREEAKWAGPGMGAGKRR